MGMDEITTGGGHFDVGGFGLYMWGLEKMRDWRDLVMWISEMPHRILKGRVDSESSEQTLPAAKRALKFYGNFWS